MIEMTSYERFKRMYEHREADRVPMGAGPWASTIARWEREGLPKGVHIQEYFGLDRGGGLPGMDTTPRFPREVIEETDTYIIDRDAWGTTKKNWKPVSSTPLGIDHLIKDADSWYKAKERMTPSQDRVAWVQLDETYKQLRRQEAWIVAAPMFGYDIVNARIVGTETLLLAMAADPEWVMDILNHLCDLALALLDMVWDAGYPFDELSWFDDMGYRNGLLFSKRMWHEMVQPYQVRTIEWAHRHGIKANLHSCGNIMELVPDLVEMGLDGLNPLEVKAGMDPLGIKRDYGDRLLLCGGLDVRRWDVYEEAEADICEKLPVLKASGGYVFGPDHSVPDSISLDTFRRIVELGKRAGRYAS